MAGICFFYDNTDVDVWSGKKLDAWNYACMAAGDIDKIIVVNQADKEPECPGQQYDFQIVPDLKEAKLEGDLAQIVCPWEFGDQTTSLWDFNHKVDWYVFGPARGWNNLDLRGHLITIPQAGKGSLHSVHIATTVLLNRYSKCQLA